MRRARLTLGPSGLIILASCAALASAATAVRPLAAAQSWSSPQSQGIDDATSVRLDTIGCAKRGLGASEVAVLDFKGEIPSAFDSDRIYATLNAVAGNPSIGAAALRIAITSSRTGTTR